MQLLMMIIRLVGIVLYAQSMWEWFLVPLGMPMIGRAHAFGITTFIGHITFQVNGHTIDTITSRISEDDKFYDTLFSSLWPWLGMGMGWIIKSFM